jgi:hypothetical protein
MALNISDHKMNLVILSNFKIQFLVCSWLQVRHGRERPLSSSNWFEIQKYEFSFVNTSQTHCTPGP